jgi:hypothetical protein
MPFMLTAGPYTAGQALLVGGLSVAALAFVLVLYDRRRFHWVGRALAAAVALAYGWYLAYEICCSRIPFDIHAPRGQANPRNALLGYIVWGAPALYYAVFGRLWRLPSHLPAVEPKEPDTEAADMDREA